jgi:hypothetical protein
LVEYLLRSFTKFLEMEPFFRSRSFYGGPVWQKKKKLETELISWRGALPNSPIDQLGSPARYARFFSTKPFQNHQRPPPLPAYHPGHSSSPTTDV